MVPGEQYQVLLDPIRLAGAGLSVLDGAAKQSHEAVGDTQRLLSLATDRHEINQRNAPQVAAVTADEFLLLHKEGPEIEGYLASGGRPRSSQ